MTVTNSGPSDSQGLTVRGASAVFVGPKPLPVTATPGTACSVTGDIVTCTWSTLPAAETRTAVVTVNWRSSAGNVCLAATASSATTDPVATNSILEVCTAKR